MKYPKMESVSTLGMAVVTFPANTSREAVSTFGEQWREGSSQPCLIMYEGMTIKIINKPVPFVDSLVMLMTAWLYTPTKKASDVTDPTKDEVEFIVNHLVRGMY